MFMQTYINYNKKKNKGGNEPKKVMVLSIQVVCLYIAAYSVIAAKRIAKLLNANKDAVKMKLKPHQPSHDV